MDKRRQVDEEVWQFSDAFMKVMLDIIDIEMPDYSYRISDLVPLDSKQHFGATFIPQLEFRARKLSKGECDREELNGWIDSELRGYGPDAPAARCQRLPRLP